MIGTYRYRVKDANHYRWVDKKARAVNFVWNWCNGAQKHAVRHNQPWPSGFDLSNLAAGAGKMLGLHSQSVQANRRARNKGMGMQRLRYGP